MEDDVYNHNHPPIQSHEVGECPEPYYGNACSGIATWRIDPYDEDLSSGSRLNYRYLCQGVHAGLLADI